MGLFSPQRQPPNHSHGNTQINQINEADINTYLQFLLEVLQENPQVVYPLLEANTDKLNLAFAQLLQVWATNTLEEAEPDVKQFLLEVLQATAESQYNPQVVYPLLEANTDKLNLAFAQLLQVWATNTLEEAEPDVKQFFAVVLGEFSNLIQQFPLGNKANKMEIAITGYEIVSTVFTRDTSPELWGSSQNNLGIAYGNRIRGDKAENLEYAIAAYYQALEVCTRTDFPVEWATTQNNLGNAYCNRIRGDKAENLEYAIAACTQALEVSTRTDFPEQWAMTQNNLGNAYGDRIRGDKAENLEIAIAAYSQALEIYTRTDFPVQWATTQNNLGEAYRNRIRGDKAENLENAIAAYTQALEIYTRTDFPVDWATTQNNLAAAYGDRIRGDKAENLEIAIAAYSQALEVRTRTDFPVDWAMTQNNLGIAYGNRIRGDKAENLEYAIAAYTQALEVYTRTDFPEQWATTQNNLAAAYDGRIRGDKAENLEMAIAAYTQALEVRTRTDFPEQWATTQNNLAAAYGNRIRGDKAENLEYAIAAYYQALEVCTRTDFPVKWATTQNNLGNAYCNRIRGDKAENLEYAIAACTQALEVSTRTDFPEQWAMTQNNLGNAYGDRIRGDKAENLEYAIAACTQALEVRTRTDFPVDWAMTQNDLGIAYFNRIRGDKAENLEYAIAACTQALEVSTRTDFPEQWAMTQNNLGIAYFNRIRGDKAENLEYAIAAYYQALEVYTRSDFPVNWAATQHNLGAAYSDVANFGDDFYLLAIAKLLHGQYWAMTQNNLAAAYSDVADFGYDFYLLAIAKLLHGQYFRLLDFYFHTLIQQRPYSDRIRGDKAENLEIAIAAYTQALEVYTRTNFPEQWAMTQNNLGIAYGDRIRGDKAENLEYAIAAYTQALEVYTRTNFPEQWAGTQNNLGSAYLINRIRGDQAENLEYAIAAYTQALEVRTRSDFPVENAQTLFNLGILYQESQQFDLAYDTLKSAIATVEDIRGEIISGEASKRKQAEKWNKLFVGMVEVCLALGKTTEAITYIERSKTRNLVEQILNRDLKTSFPDEVATELGQLRDKIAIAQDLLQKGNATFLRQDIEKLRQQKQQLQDTYLPIGSSFEFTSLQNIVDDKTAIIEWYITSDKILAVVIQPGGKEIKIWQSSSADREALIGIMPEFFNHYQWQNQLEQSLQKLAEILHIEEILQRIPPQCQKLILIPHLFLHLLPLHALPVRNSYLMDLFPQGVGYAPSYQLLQQTQLRQRDDFQSLFAIQTPTEDLYEKDLGAVAAIKKQFAKTYVLKKEQAQKSAIIPNNENLTKANNLFFFCHGSFNSDSPLDSGLQLADEVLTLADIITHIKLENCRLVTLAACETGITDFTSTSDEYIGLPSGFLLAGSTNVVSSLWSVNATATALLMVKFYKELKHQKNIVLALQNSQRWLRETNITGFKQWVKESSLSFASQNQIIKYFDITEQKNSENYQPFSLPVYWSAFCCIGKGV
ncbi:tetratricopeptide repeat protein [Dolichospermum sp. LEGE 00246]|nr:tetratricopeptide repeat protein [Dolichospermum sp. LEGE 00246]